ncbi:YncE family protein [Paraconexibacter algicola]|uniref:Superoxide dismutase n=1 Tax=Paraconexibacter algicola TaxID=2133960 RepID=A0A2T4UGE2_9ACTN|nr:superoxide dismutase [Paraconexibacter algicola]PTL58269.1 superoxide dismutase [Paraconexibacter algicola]
MSPRSLLSLALAVLAAALAATAVGASADGRPDRSPKPSTYTIPGDRVFPEGIAAAGRTFFVGSTTDGTIFRGDTRRDALVPFSPGGQDGRTTAIGMKVLGRSLVVAGGATGKVFVLDTRTGRTTATLDTQPGQTPAFLNDVAVAGRRTAYVTDSQRPILWKVDLGSRGRAASITPFLDFTGTAFAYQTGFNANGIVAAKGGRVLLVVQSNTGKVFRVDTRTKEVSQVDLGGTALTNGDGLVLAGRTLLVVRNQQELVVPVRLSKDLRRGAVGSGVTSPALKYPTTGALVGGRLLLVNAQFDKRNSGTAPELPFDVAALDLRRGR